MDFDLDDAQARQQAAARELAAAIAPDTSVAEVVARAAASGLAGPDDDLLASVVTVEALAEVSASAALAVALHASVAPGVSSHGRGEAVRRGETVGGVALSSDEVPELRDGRLWGQASWVAPLTPQGVAVVGVPGAEGPQAVAVALDDAGVEQQPVEISALDGLVCGHLRFDGAPSTTLGPASPFMARVRILLAAAGLGMGGRALREALGAARGRTGHGAGGEQTVQGLLADAATDLDAARLLTWKAAIADEPNLVEASMAKLAATEATQRAVLRATQVVGAESFRAGHVIERLARDVRALELFAGRTEALREAVALGTLPQV
jgi:alkylation response protein AidB-like acyl-CoA dehydrogenase